MVHACYSSTWETEASPAQWESQEKGNGWGRTSSLTSVFISSTVALISRRSSFCPRERQCRVAVGKRTHSELMPAQYMDSNGKWRCCWTAKWTRCIEHSHKVWDKLSVVKLTTHRMIHLGIFQSFKHVIFRLLVTDKAKSNKTISILCMFIPILWMRKLRSTSKF